MRDFDYLFILITQKLNETKYFSFHPLNIYKIHILHTLKYQKLKTEGIRERIRFSYYLGSSLFLSWGFEMITFSSFFFLSIFRFLPLLFVVLPQTHTHFFSVYTFLFSRLMFISTKITSIEINRVKLYIKTKKKL